MIKGILMRKIKYFPAFVLDVFLHKIRLGAIKFRALRYPGIDGTVRLGGSCDLTGPPQSIAIGKGTYLNGAHLMGDCNGKIVIGEDCCVGYRVSIKSWTHDISNPCLRIDGQIAGRSSDIVIGDRVWIGDGVFIREGVAIGSDSIIGANTVVTKSFPPGSIVAGVPAKMLRLRQTGGQDNNEHHSPE